MRRVKILAAVTASAFAGAALMSQASVVPSWRALPPDVFLRRFPTSGPATGGTAFPFELASMLLLAKVAAAARGSRRPGRVFWLLSAACMGGTFVLLVYFLPANLALLRPTVPVESVPGALAEWNRWNWVRTGLGVASAALAGSAMIMEGGPPAPAGRSAASVQADAR